MSDLPRLGFVGLGVMGEPMSGHLVAAGYPLWIYDVSREAAQRVVAGHPSVQIAGTPAELAAEVDIVITMLPDGEVVRSVVFGEHGLMHGLRAGSLVLDTSSSQPWLTTATAAELGERGIDMVDAAVSGAQWGAQAAELVFMVGASSAESLARVTPILDVLGKAWFHTMKCINNTITAMTFLATA
jgi:3-hydroxyisobutyrate dehydrogenase